MKMIARYFLVGGAAAVIDLAIFSLMVKGLHQPWFEAALVSFFIATTANYLLSTRFVFSSGARFSRRHHEFGAVVLVSLAGLAINQIVLWLVIERLHLDPLIAKVIGTGVVFFWNYGVRKRYLFRMKI
ncbi:GtrA family protein [Pinirhizobacter soli]|uniref:GtrA family protein n=1 Tax=Pinirhizobacter soli TaxID=2786953 RepID=UPI002029DF65|nr:GtrA family protein [Pinirhizobacter soli]